MPGERTFQLLFETFGKLPDCHAPSVNQSALEKLRNLLEEPIEAPGHCILLKAPRAGHGKTHLLTRLQHELGGSHEFIPVHASGGSGITPATVLDDTLRRLVRSLPAAGGLTVLDLIARRLFSTALQPLVRSGEVPCQDREAALNALRTRPVETFDFHHPSAVTAHWAKENFELLGPRLALELSQNHTLPHRETAFWVDAMFQFASTPIDNPVRVRTLAATVFEDPAAEQAAHQRLVSLLGLMGTMLRVVLVADELEGFSADEASALSFASFVGALRQSVDRLEIILSVNQDIWENAFLPRLSGGLADRLSEVTVDLEPLNREGKIALIESRAPGKGEKILARLDADSIPSHARGVIKEAADAEVKNGILSTDNKQVGTVSTGSLNAEQWPKEQPFENSNETFQAPVPTSEPFQGPAPEPAAASEPTPETKSATKPEPEPNPEANPGSSPGHDPEPAEAGFSPEAAIAAFSNFRKGDPAEEDLGGFLPPSEPFSEKAEESASKFSAPVTEAAESPRTVPPAESNPFQAPPGIGAPQPEPPSAPPAVPEPLENPFQAPPAGVATQPEAPSAPQQENPFQAHPAKETPVQAFQAAPPAAEPPVGHPPAQETPAPDPQPEESKTDRVDDLLKQFRERYGKS